MNATVEPLLFRIVVDDAGVPAASERTRDALGKLGERAGGAKTQFTKLRGDTSLTRQELLALNYTASDVAASLASGTSPFTILLQQGGQVRDAFGGFGNLFSKLGATLTIGRVAFAGLAGAAGLAATAFFQGEKQSRDFDRALQLTGNRAGVTAGSFEAMTRSIATNSRTSTGLAREVLQAALETGQFGPQAIGAVGAAAATLARITGRSADEVVKDFASMSSGVAQWAAEHNRSYAYLTVEQYKYIRSLQAQGRTEEAMRVNAELLDKALKQRQPELGTLQRLWEGVKNAASGAWDAMLAIGRAETSDQLMERLRNQLTLQKEALEFEQNGRGTEAQIAGRKRIIATLETQLENERELAKFKGQSAAADARNEAAKVKAVEEQSRGFVDRRLELERALFSQSQAQRDLAREREAIADKRALDFGELNATAYMNRRIARERAALNDREAAINEEIALERKRVIEKPEDAVAQQARLVDIGARRNAVLKERAQLEDRIARGELYTPGPDPLETVQQQFIKFERARQAETEKAIADRNTASAEGVTELLRINREASIELILDDQARGRERIALDEEELRKRLDLASMSAGDRKNAEDALARWRVLRERQLTEQLKPEYQRQLELFQDLNRYMKQASDEARTGWLNTGREAFVEWVKGGKDATKRLTDYIIERFAAIAYDRFLAGAFDSLGKSIFGALGGLIGSGGGGSSGGDWFSSFLSDVGISGLASGGTASRGSFHQVNELGPELLTVRGRDFLMMGADPGVVTPAGDFGMGGARIDASINGLSVGAGVSLPQVHSIVQQANQRQFERIRRLLVQGRL